MVVRAVLAAVAAASVAAAAPEAASAGSNTFRGFTSQGAPDYVVGFHVDRNQVKGFHITWRGKCVSEQQIFLSTSQRSATITIRNGGWSSVWSYRAKLPFASGMTGRFTVVENTAHISGHRVHGTFSVRVTLYLGSTVNDRCQSGPIRWSATRG